METVKVDIQKLQLLNDRIAQTIEALNQVRMSVHGISHAPTSPWGYGAYPGAQLGFAQGMNPQFNPYTMPFVPQFGPQQFGPQQFGPQQFGPQQFGPQQFAGQFGGPTSYGVSPYGGQFGVGGLSHTTPYGQFTGGVLPTTPYGQFVGAGGLSHSTQTPWQVTQTPWQSVQTPWQSTTTPWQTTGQAPWLTGNGISHTSWDPTWQTRSQQWPFVGYPTTLS
jgi:hypothetical protein